jgi:hypothetical protein
MSEGGADVVRTRFGEAARCTATAKRSGRRCGRPARKGFGVCPVHGGGCRVREVAGIRKNPKLGGFLHGGRAQPGTLAMLGEIDAAFAAARAEVAGRPARLRDVGEVLADMWALRRLLVQQVQVGLDDRQPPAVLQVLDSLAATIERAARIEQRLSQPEQHVHMSLVNALVGNTVAVLEQFVEPVHREAALDKLRYLHTTITARQER